MASGDTGRLSNPNSPLEESAINNYIPTNAEIMAELHRQNGIMRGILHQTTKTNGRVDKLEIETIPVVRDHKMIKKLVTVSVVAAPCAFKLCEVVLNYVFPTH